MEHMESRMQDQIEGAEIAFEQAMQAGQESAFPVVWPDDKGVQFYGITIRDYFAAKAMQALCSGGYARHAELAADAYSLADAMLEARTK
ncbi:hypothetical protein D9M68_791380 [compost metagenome]